MQITLLRDSKKFKLDYSTHFQHVVQVSDSLNRGAATHYRASGLTYVDVPQIVGITGACENVDTLFRVGNHLDLPLFFTQTGQLALEQTLQSVPGAFTVIHSGRDEEIEDARHLRQFRLTEEEFDCTLEGMNRNNYDEEKMFEALLLHIQRAVQAIIAQIVKDHEPLLAKTYKRDVAKLKQAAKTDFLRISYEEAVELLKQNGFPRLTFGDDLEALHEARVVKLLNKKGSELPVFIMRYPKEIKFFNMKVSERDPRVVLSADLILPRAGESTGSAVREHDFARLNERLVTSTMYKLHLDRGGTYEDFAWYLNIIRKQGTMPHAGYGIGNERVLQYIFASDDIRTTSVFSLLDKQSGDWSKKRYGQGTTFTGQKSTVLLTIGHMADKKALLPAIQKVAGNPNVILYATEHTHDFLKQKGIMTSLVHKVSEIGKQPNISDLLGKRLFDIIVNIPMRRQKKVGSGFTDGKLIRKGAVDMGVSLYTDVEVASRVLERLGGE